MARGARLLDRRGVEGRGHDLCRHRGEREERGIDRQGAEGLPHDPKGARLRPIRLRVYIHRQLVEAIEGQHAVFLQQHAGEVRLRGSRLGPLPRAEALCGEHGIEEGGAVRVRAGARLDSAVESEPPTVPWPVLHSALVPQNDRAPSAKGRKLDMKGP